MFGQRVQKKSVKARLQSVWLAQSTVGKQKKDDDFKSVKNGPNQKTNLISPTLKSISPKNIEEIASNLRYFNIGDLGKNWGINPIIIWIVSGIVAFFIVWKVFWQSPPVSHPNIRTKTHSKTLLNAEQIELAQYTTKLVDYRNNSKIKDFEETLVIVMERFCLDLLDYPLTGEALETFHFNLAKTFTFVAEGGSFHDYHDMKITYEGGIIDPHNTDETDDVLTNHLQTCPLLEQIFHEGLKNNGANGPLDEKDEFDSGYNFKEMDEGLLWLRNLMSTNGECSHLGVELSNDSQKAFMMNTLLAMNKISNQKDLADTWSHYVVSRSGSVLRIQSLDDKTGDHLWCQRLESALNANHIWTEPWVAELATATLRKAIDDEKLQHLDARLREPTQ